MYAIRSYYGLNNLEIFNRPMHETAIELTYAFNLVNNIRVQPDLQYCINPGQAIQLNNALTAFLRIVISH